MPHIPLLSLPLLIIFLSLLLPLPLSHAHGGAVLTNSFSPSSSLDASGFKAQWKTYENDDDEMVVDFYVTVKNQEWLAIGFGKAGANADFDVIMAYSNNIEVFDRYQEDSMPPFVPENDTTYGGLYSIESSAIKYTTDLLQVNFTRKLDTGDTFDYNLMSSGSLQILWGYGWMNGTIAGLGTDKLEYFVREEMEGEEGQKLKAHGILMSLVVLLLMTSGLVFSRYLKLIFPLWFYAHTAILCLADFFVLVSTILIFQAHNNKFEPSWHSFFGLFFISLMGLQTILGLVAHFRFDKKRTAPPVFPDKIHWYIGRFLYAFGLVTVVLGLYALPARTFAKNAMWTFFVVLFFFVLALEKYIGQTHETAVKGIAEDDEAFATSNDDDAETTYTPKRGNSLSRGVVPRTYSARFLFKLLAIPGFAILLLYILLAVGINTTEL